MSQQDVSYEDLVYAKYQVREAKERLKRVKERAFLSDEEKEISNVTTEDMNPFSLRFDAPNMILDLQLCIELSVKSMFISVGVSHPEKHDIEFKDDRTEGLLRNIPSEFEDSDEIPRAVFLTQFWHQFYELSKYGVPNLGIKPTELLTEEDNKKAIKDAAYCAELAENLVNYQEESELENEISVAEFWT